jgi:hypothetical protein
MTSAGEEARPMETYINERPWAPLYAPASLSAVRIALTADVPSVPQVHQVQAEARTGLPLTVAPNATGIQGTSGFMGEGVLAAEKRTDVRGVPPRGRPV